MATKKSMRAIYEVPGRKTSGSKKAGSLQSAVNNAASQEASTIYVTVVEKRRVPAPGTSRTFARTDVGDERAVCFRAEQPIASGPRKGQREVICKGPVRKAAKKAKVYGPKLPKGFVRRPYQEPTPFQLGAGASEPRMGWSMAAEDRMAGVSPLEAIRRARERARTPAPKPRKSKSRGR